MSASPSSSSSSLSPENTENMEISENSPKNCQVCGQKSHGSHFGAVTCRACAAFFRRVAAGASFVIKCRNGDGKCEILMNGRSCCKKCRLKKCKEVGMDIQNFQFDRDLISTTKKKIPPSLANFLGRPQFIIFCDPETASSSKNGQMIIDLSELLEKARKILEKSGEKHQKTGQNRLRKMIMGLNIDRDEDEEKFQKITNIGLKETMSFWEYDVLAVATWLSFFDEFQELELHVKMKFLKTFWHVWNRIEKLARTALTRRKTKSTVVVAGNGHLDVLKMSLDIGWLTNFSLEQITYYIEGVGDFSTFDVIPHLAELDPTDVELNYMMAHLSFQYAGKQLGGKYLEISENLQVILAEDLHNYYTRDLQMTRYSDRVLKMMKINNMVQKYLRERQEKMGIAKLFDIFHVKFSDPDMFEGIY